MDKWKNLPTTKACNCPLTQLRWKAKVVEYVMFLWNATHCCNPKAMTAKTLRFDVPILGLHFVSLIYLHSQLRPGPTDVQPDIQYLKPISIIHPLYYPELIKWPRCQSSKDVTWGGVDNNGHM